MKKKILIPTDFSKNAWHALTYTLELFKEEECDFYVLNAYQPDSYLLDSMMVPEPGEKYYEQCKKQSEDGLEHLFLQLKERDNNALHTYHTISSIGLLIDTILEEIERKDIDLVAMGTKGASGTYGTLFGSNTIYTMETVRNCPVLAIPQEALFKDFKEIVFPTSYRIHVKRAELQSLIDIAKLVGASIRFVHVAYNDKLDERQLENKKLLELYFSAIDHSFHTLHKGNTATALSNFVESRSSDMIGFVSKKHSFFGSLFSRPLVKELGFYSKIPILAMHDRR
ncbi:MAG: universal stress protein [Leeuwenhoekiella sp.]